MSKIFILVIMVYHLTIGMITGAASGVLRSILVDPGNRADIVPVDVVINLVALPLIRD